MDLEVLGSLSNVQLAVYNYYFLRAQQCLHQTCFIQSGWMEFSVDFFAQNNGTALTSRFTRVRVIPRMTRRYLTWHCLFLENHSTCMSRSINFAFFPELLSHTNGKYSLFPNRTLVSIWSSGSSWSPQLFQKLLRWSRRLEWLVVSM